jgi:hypothetical protein
MGNKEANKIIVEKHPDGYIAYPLGIKGIVVGQGDSYEKALEDAGINPEKDYVVFAVGEGATTMAPAMPFPTRTVLSRRQIESHMIQVHFVANDATMLSQLPMTSVVNLFEGFYRAFPNWLAGFVVKTIDRTIDDCLFIIVHYPVVLSCPVVLKGSLLVVSNNVP